MKVGRCHAIMNQGLIRSGEHRIKPLPAWTSFIREGDRPETWRQDKLFVTVSPENDLEVGEGSEGKATRAVTDLVSEKRSRSELGED